MMRLQRIGRKNDPSFRVVVTNKRNGPRAGNHVDTIGSYNPKLGNFQIDAEKAKHWISKGVQPSDTVHNFLISQGIIEGKKRNVLPKKSPIVSEKEPEEVKESETKAEAPADTQEEAPTEEETPTEEAPAEPEEKEEVPPEVKEEPVVEEKSVEQEKDK